MRVNICPGKVKVLVKLLQDLMIFPSFCFESLNFSLLNNVLKGIEGVYKFVNVKYPAKYEIVDGRGGTITSWYVAIGHLIGNEQSGFASRRRTYWLGRKWVLLRPVSRVFNRCCCSPSLTRQSLLMFNSRVRA